MTELGHEELVAALNEMLEEARSGVSVIQVYLRRSTDEEVRQGLKEAIVSQARVCSTVYHHIQGLGGEPSTRVADLAEGTHGLTEVGLQMEAVAGLLEGFLGLVEGHLTHLDAFDRDFFTEVLIEHRQHLDWARNMARRHRL